MEVQRLISVWDNYVIVPEKPLLSVKNGVLISAS